MFSIQNNFSSANNLLLSQITKLRKKGYNILVQKHQLNEKYFIEKLTIKSKKKAKNRLIISSGLHGVEGYVGHAAIKAFFDSILETLNDSVEVIIYPTINPYGMDTFQRTNMDNIDLNRNFSNNNFTSKNENYLTIKSFVEPREFKNQIIMNSTFYYDLTKLITKNGVKFLNDALLLGQQHQQNGIYYTGDSYAKETQYILSEFNDFMKTKVPLTWIDIHSGFGPKDQMSIINSKYEKDTTLEMIEKCNYPLILGINEDDIYDTDGDILEKLYDIQKNSFKKSEFYATCFEFGTVGQSTIKSIESLKSILFMNHVRYVKSNAHLLEYATKLMKRQFAPKSEKWRTKAHQDFVQAMTTILEYKKLV